MLKPYSDYVWCNSQEGYVDSVLCEVSGNKCSNCRCEKVEKEEEQE